MKELSKGNDMCKDPEVGADRIFNCEEANVAGVKLSLNSHDYCI